MTAALLTFGTLLRQLRCGRELSQLELAAIAGASARHLSFLETGRARPSEAMVSRLATALGLNPSGFDDLRTAAGFCAHNARRGPSIGDRIFKSALAMDGARTPAQVVDAARSLLHEMGIVQFFFGTLQDGPTPGFDWANFGAFPPSWLHRYDRERYAQTDPLLAVARARPDSFFWDDVIDRRSLKRPAREMFDRAEARGISAGFVLSRRRPGSTHIVSMMGACVDHRRPAARVGLEIMGSRMLTSLERLGALPSGIASRKLPQE